MPSVWYGTGIPILVSVVLVLAFKKNIHIPTVAIVFFVLSLLADIFISHWSATGLHQLSIGVILWPLLALVVPRFSWPMAYPLTFTSNVLGDLWGAGWYFHFSGLWWAGIGGAGFYDGNFVNPLTALLCAGACHYLGIFLRWKRIFTTKMYS